MSSNGSVAPKERINVTFKPAASVQEEKELPLKTMVIGDFTQREDTRALEDRKPIAVDKTNFDDVLANQELSLDISVPNHLTNGEEDAPEELAVNLKFKELKDFNPENIIKNVSELRELMKLRDALVSLKGPLGNAPAFRKAIEEVLTDEAARTSILDELNLKEETTIVSKD